MEVRNSQIKPKQLLLRLDKQHVENKAKVSHRKKRVMHKEKKVSKQVKQINEGGMKRHYLVPHAFSSDWINGRKFTMKDPFGLEANTYNDL
ncbi:hypothetical protein TNCV_3470001 [Trichonephila clavipes]|nr:hypothetical protein TNCV_3470001 [Trichonephila clavipes]